MGLKFGNSLILAIVFLSACSPNPEQAGKNSSVVSSPSASLYLPRFLRQHDKNYDGQLTRDELHQSKSIEVFDQMDQNRDGFVNGTEAFAYQTNRRAVNAPKVVEETAEGEGLDLAGEFIRLTKLAKEPLPTQAPWRQFLGPNRDGIAIEGPTLSRDWLDIEPVVQWRTTMSGGFGGAAIDQGRVFILDRTATNEEVVRCFHFESGEELWHYRYPTRNVRLPFSGSRTVPTVEGNLLWTVGAVGDIRCLDWRAGKLLWRVDLVEFTGQEIPPRWGVSQAPLVLADLVIVPAISDINGFVCGFDKASGKLSWITPNLGEAHYVTPTFQTINGVGQILMFGRTIERTGAWFGLNPANGEVFWKWTGYSNPAQITHPVSLGNNRFWITGGYDVGSSIVKISQGEGRGWKIREIGEHPTAGSQVHTPLVFGGHIYANLNTNENKRRSRRGEGGLGCFDFNGKLNWKTGNSPYFGRGGLLIADGLILAMDGDTGELMLIDPTPEVYRELARFEVFHNSGGQIWAPLAIADGRLVLRSQNELVCLDIREQP